MSITIKICGLSTPDTVDTVVRNGADMVGFNFFERSPRHVAFDKAREFATQVSGQITRVGLTVDFSNEQIADLLKQVPLDMLQLHGKETPSRVAEVRKTFGMPVMKALPVADDADLMVANEYRDVVDRFLFDAKPPKDSDRPGGNAVTFDWNLMQKYALDIPWLLAGGLSQDNVAEAIKTSGAKGVDLSSAIESAPGIKDNGLIRSFIHTVRGI